jgi:serine/threonine protein phosphatase PrpC
MTIPSHRSSHVDHAARVHDALSRGAPARDRADSIEGAAPHSGRAVRANFADFNAGFDENEAFKAAIKASEASKALSRAAKDDGKESGAGSLANSAANSRKRARTFDYASFNGKFDEKDALDSAIKASQKSSSDDDGKESGPSARKKAKSSDHDDEKAAVNGKDEKKGPAHRSSDFDEKEEAFHSASPSAGAGSGSAASLQDLSRPITAFEEMGKLFKKVVLTSAALQKEITEKTALVKGKYEGIRALPAAPKNSKWLPRKLPLDRAMQKMWKNTIKAIEEHRAKSHDPAYATVDEVLYSLREAEKTKRERPLTFSFGADGQQGVRPTMEDAHFHKMIPEGLLEAVFDGHGIGDVNELVDFASNAFQKGFSAELSAANGNVHQAFESLIYKINEEICRKWEGVPIGSTATIAFTDPKTGLCFVANLADSEATVMRKIKGKWKVIPLSCVRDWTSEKEALRAAINKGNPKLAHAYINEAQPKKLRPAIVNVSRALGDTRSQGTKEKPLVIAKPKISVIQLLAGDIFEIACDGKHDYVTATESVDLVTKTGTRMPILARKNTAFALKDKKSSDNVTVLETLVQ